MALNLQERVPGFPNGTNLKRLLHHLSVRAKALKGIFCAVSVLLNQAILSDPTHGFQSLVSCHLFVNMFKIQLRYALYSFVIS